LGNARYGSVYELDYSSMALSVDTHSTMQAAKKLFNMTVSNFMAVLR
jgi:hypothetical protein